MLFQVRCRRDFVTTCVIGDTGVVGYGGGDGDVDWLEYAIGFADLMLWKKLIRWRFYYSSTVLNHNFLLVLTIETIYFYHFIS